MELNNATLAVTLRYLATPGTAFTIVTNAAGHFANLPEGALIVAGQLRLRVSYTGGANGRDVVLTAELPGPPVRPLRLSRRVPPTPPGPPGPSER